MTMAWTDIEWDLWSATIKVLPPVKPRMGAAVNDFACSCCDALEHGDDQDCSLWLHSSEGLVSVIKRACCVGQARV